MKKINVAILDYKMGNIASLKNSLNYLSAKFEIVSNPKNLKNKTHIILPGVGSYKLAMKNIRSLKIEESLKYYVKEKKINILGICLGMQLIGKSSTENGYTKGLGFIDCVVRPFNKKEVKNQKIPHVGFNSINFNKENKFLKGIKSNSDFYFDHSFRMTQGNLSENFALCNYGVDFLAAFNINNIFGTQFHPEKSQSNGLRVLSNFLKS